MSSISLIPGSLVGVNSITSIIPSMIFGLILIIAWLPIIYFTEKNNKGNVDEYNLLLEKIDKNIKLTDVTDRIMFPYKYISDTPDVISSSSISKYDDIKDILKYDDIKDISINGYKINNKALVNNNVLIKQTIITKTKDSNGKEMTTIKTGTSVVFSPSIDGSIMEDNDYEYLAMQNKTFSTKIKDENNENITYEINVYSIPIGKQIIKVEGLQEFQSELDITIYNYEFGPKENAINVIKNRKSSINTIQKWGGRIATFLMLFFGLSLLVSPLKIIVSLGNALPGPLQLIAIPGRILLSIYNALSFFGSIILTILMTMFIWSLVNYPIVSVLFGGLLIGLIIYFNKHSKL
jgi:hypothetical protein